MKKTALVTAVILLLSTAVFADTMYLKIGEPRILLSGEMGFVDAQNPDVTPVVIDGRTLVPVRVIAEGFGYDVAWVEDTQTVILSDAQSLVTLQISSTVIKRETAGKVTEIPTDVPPQIIGGRTFLPLRVIAEGVLGKTVTWYEQSQMIYIADSGEAPVFDIDARFAPAAYDLKGFPRIDCSTATVPFVNALYKKLLGIGNTAAESLTVSSKTHGAYVRLINGECDIIFVAEPNAEQLDFAKAAGVELDIRPFATEGFVFLTHKDNPVNSLTAEQVRQIYEGVITNWKEVGGADEEIVAYQRNANSGSQTIMENLVMEGRTLMSPPTHQVIQGMGELITAVANYENTRAAIGYSVYYYANEMIKNPNVKLLEIDGIPPTPQTIQAKRYPFTVSYFAVTVKGRTGERTQALLEWALGEQGQALVSESGYVKK